MEGQINADEHRFKEWDDKMVGIICAMLKELKKGWWHGFYGSRERIESGEFGRGEWEEVAKHEDERFLDRIIFRVDTGNRLW